MKPRYPIFRLKTKSKIIQKYIIDLIQSGHYVEVETIPSTRDLAKKFRCSRLTVLNSMRELVREGWLESNERKRYRVSKDVPLLFVDSSQKQILGNHTLKLSSFKPRSPEPEQVRCGFEFNAGNPDLRLFPMEDFRRAVGAGLKKTFAANLTYGEPNGIKAFREQYQEHLLKSRGIAKRELLITNGSQEAVFLLTRMLCQPGDTVVMEELGYPPIRDIFQSMGVKIKYVTLDSEGLSVLEIAEYVKKHRIKAVYLTPLHQYPTTVALSFQRRQILSSLALKNHFAIIEDDFDYDFHYTKIPPPSISTQCANSFYVCSMSKSLFPGLRLGAIATHPNFSDELSFLKRTLNRQTNSLAQIAVASWMRNDTFLVHLRRMRRIYQERYYFLIEALQRWKDSLNIEFNTPNGGLCVWVDTRRDADEISRELLKRNIKISAESEFRFHGHRSTHLRFGFSSLNLSELKEVLPRVENAIRKAKY